MYLFQIFRIEIYQGEQANIFDPKTNLYSSANSSLILKESTHLYHGKCVTAVLRNLQHITKDYLKITWNKMPPDTQITAFLHRHHSETELLAIPYWLKPPNQLTISERQSIDVKVSFLKYSYLKTPGYCTLELFYIDHVDCVVKTVQEACRNSSVCCRHPITLTLSQNASWSCSNRDEMSRSREYLFKIVEEAGGVCLNACNDVDIKYSDIKRKIYTENGRAELKLHFATGYIDIHEQYLVFEYTTIIASVGGSLGMFLGFSFLSCFSDLIDRFHVEK